MRARLIVAVFAVLLAACSSDSDTASPSSTVPSTTVTTPPPTTTSTVPEAPLYLDATQPVGARVTDLLGRMTLDEKIGQMTLAERKALTPEQLAEYEVGALLSGGGSAPTPNTPEAWVEMITGFQDAALGTRLGIPILYGSDAVHGHNNLVDAVIFPHNIGLGAAGDTDLVEQIGRATAIEAAATGVNWNYAPVLAVPQDIRWGRTYEAFGEDTGLVTALGTALLRGLQGDDLRAGDTVLATPKHFVGDGAAEWGTSTTDTYSIDQGDTSISEEALRAIHLAPYYDAVDAGALSVMASYSSFQGTKLHASRFLITDVLKGELGFQGFVVSDWAAIDQIDPDDYAGSIVTAINAGIDMNMVPNAYRVFIDALRAAVERGEVPMIRIDDAVARILRAKFEMGLFENPYPDGALLAAIGSDAHRELAAEAVERSLVLLTHDGETLPVSSDVILVAGGAANDVGRQSGGWTVTWQGGAGRITSGSTILDGIREAAGDAEVVYDATARFAGEGMPDSAGTGIVVVGEFPYAEGRGDNDRLVLNSRDREVIETMRARVDRLVVVVVSGRPLLIDHVVPLADAIVAAWLPGSEGGAVAGPLFGEVPFAGRSPFTWPRSLDQLPLGTVADSEGCDAPLFAFGHGLTVDDTFLPLLPDCEASS